MALRLSRHIEPARVCRSPTAAAACVAGVLASLLPATMAEAQSRDEFQAWNAAMITADLGPDHMPGPALWLDIHLRQGERDRVHIVRPGLGLRVTPNLSLWAGYAWVPVSPDEGDVRHEHRIWQQATLRFAWPQRIKFQSRTRYEQRFSDQGGEVGLRIRQMLRASWMPHASIPIGLVGWDEVMFGFNDTDWGLRGGFDQNRTFLGALMQVNEWARFEVGYLLAVLDREPETVIAHALSVNFFGVLRPPVAAMCSTGCQCTYRSTASEPQTMTRENSWFRTDTPPTALPQEPAEARSWFRPPAPTPERSWFRPPAPTRERSWFPPPAPAPERTWFR